MSLYLQTKVEESSSKEIYEDIHSLIKEITRESSSSFEVGLSFKFSPTEPSSADAGSAGAGSDAGSAGEGGDVASPGEAGEAASPSEDGEAVGPGVGGEAEGPGDGGDAAMPGGGQNAGAGMGFSASAGIDTKKEKTNIIKELSEITETKVSEIQVYSFYCFLEQLFLNHLNFIYCKSHFQAHEPPCSWNRLKQKNTKIFTINKHYLFMWSMKRKNKDYLLKSATYVLLLLLARALFQRKTFMRVKGRVELATYRMRQRGLEVSSTFLDDVDALPLTYEKGQYFAFLEDYGTHFTKNGKSGGEYELVYIMNEDIRKLKREFKITFQVFCKAWRPWGNITRSYCNYKRYSKIL